MIEENLNEYMSKVIIVSKDISEYSDKEKGLVYPLGTASLLARVDYLELTKEELNKAIFEQKIEKKDYKMYDCVRVVPKNTVTKKDSDKFILVDKHIRATHIWNVSNQLGIHSTFENKEEAIKLCNEINNKIYKVF